MASASRTSSLPPQLEVIGQAVPSEWRGVRPPSAVTRRERTIRPLVQFRQELGVAARGLHHGYQLAVHSTRTHSAMAEALADGRLDQRATFLDRLHRDAPFLELSDLPYSEPFVKPARMPDVLVDDVGRTSLAVHALIGEQS